MNRKTVDDLAAAFSLLPGREAREARCEVSALHAAGVVDSPDLLKWAEFDTKGRFLRAGLTNVLHQTTRIIANSRQDADIHMVAARVRETDNPAGLLEMMPDGRRFLWVVPFSPNFDDEAVVLRLRALLVTEHLFQAAVTLFDSNDRLTPMELRAVFQLAAGLTPRKAALADNVSYETKRIHLKSASAKMDSGGQTDLVRRVLGQLVHLISVSESEAPVGLVDLLS